MDKNKARIDVLVQNHFTDLDAINTALSGWQIDYRQIDPGRLAADILQIRCQNVFLTHAKFNRKIDQAGGTPPGYTSFGLHGGGMEPVHVCGRELHDDSMMIFAPGQEYEGNTPNKAVLYSLSVRDEHLEKIGQQAGLQIPLQSFQTHAAMICDRNIIDGLRHRLKALCLTFGTDSSVPGMSRFQNELACQLPMMLLTALSAARGKSRRSTSRKRQIAVNRAREYMSENLETDLVIEDICRIAGVSWRTLDYAFREYLGITPKRYLAMLRLTTVRRALRQPIAGETVSAIANRWGYWHMGKFAADYKRQFGQLPSETIKGARVRRLQ